MKIKAKENDGNRITKGKTYVVIEELADVYEIICDTGNHYCAIKSIFDVVDEEKKPTRVRCIDNILAKMLTFGKEYDVIAEDSFSYRIKGDDGKITRFLKFRFEVVEDEVNNVDPVPTPIPEQCYLKVDNPSYSSLKRVLDMAYDQASSGKGKERHANNDTFESQPICQIPRYQGSIDFVTGQAIKKCLEVTKLPTVDAKVRELLGAINYIAAGIIVLQEGSNDGN
jgi:hypothetical protein